MLAAPRNVRPDLFSKRLLFVPNPVDLDSTTLLPATTKPIANDIKQPTQPGPKDKPSVTTTIAKSTEKPGFGLQGKNNSIHSGVTGMFHL